MLYTEDSNRPWKKRTIEDCRVFFAKSNVDITIGKKIQAKKALPKRKSRNTCYFCPCVTGHRDKSCYEFDVDGVKLKGYCFLDRSSACEGKKVIKVKREGRSLTYQVMNPVMRKKKTKKGVYPMHNSGSWGKLLNATEVAALGLVEDYVIPKGFKRCSGKCQKVLKLCTTFFRVKTHSKLGFSSRCKQCLSVKKRKINKLS